MKVLLWAAIGFVVVMWLLRGKDRTTGVAGARARKNPALEGETMHKCAHCGVYVPASDTVRSASGTVYCSEDHRLRHEA
jgi:uncharacterized protein